MAIDRFAGDAAAEQRLKAVHAVILKSRDLQLDFGTAEPPPAPPPNWLLQLAHNLAFLAPLLKYVLWAGLIAAGLMIIWLIGREFITLDGYGKRKRTTPLDFLKPDAQAASALLADADQLAEQGRFEEAARALLIRSVEQMNRRRPGAVRAALTARDICRLPQIPEEPRGAFSRICQVVEISLFGGRTVDRNLFQRCREDYQIFAFSDAW